VLLAVAAIGAVAGPNAWVAVATRGRSYTDVASVPARSVAIVPGSPVARGMPAPLLRARLEGAVSLYQNRRVKAILVSGNDTTASPEVTVMRAWLLNHGIPARAIWADDRGTRTRETMRRAAELFGIADAIICTESVHVARALYLAKASGIDSVGLAIPTTLSESPKWQAREALKTTLAVIESTFGVGPQAPGTIQNRATVAAR
jgi:vancomycin permeability regulator SanA